MEKSAVTKSHRASRHQAEELVLCPEGTGRTGSRVGGAGSAPGAEGPCGPCGEGLEGVRWRPREVSMRTRPEKGPGCGKREFVGQAEFG